MIFQLGKNKSLTRDSLTLADKPEVKCEDPQQVSGQPVTIRCNFTANPIASVSLQLPSGETITGDGNDQVHLSITASKVHLFD